MKQGGNVTRIKVSLDKPITIERFSSELSELIKDVSSSLKEFFEDSIDGRLGDDHRSIVIKLFNEWCARNDVTPLEDLYNVLMNKLNDIINLRENDRKSAIDELIENIAEGLKMSEKGKKDVKNTVVRCVTEAISKGGKLEEIVWTCTKELMKSYVSLFLDQSAHVIVARLLVYRVMEDKGYAPNKLINVVSNSKSDPLEVLIDIRRSHETLLPNIYTLSEFDWWYIPDTKRGLLDYQQRKILREHEDKLRRTLIRAINVLISYDLSKVNFDIWQRIYQHYLPKDERQRLGGFYTPYELVSLILDLSGYKPDTPNLCKMKVLDPACGSGTFIVEATRRLVEHLESKRECHTTPQTSWGKAKFVLDTVKENMYAIDIHPFASFLTSLNLTMLLLDYYFRIRHQDPDYRLELNVITADSLAKHVHISIATYFTNARLKEAHERLKKYEKVLGTKFNYVFGNPPWGSVLKGSLSPLWNPKKRDEYRERYKSAVGKYDACVLFLERGVEWLESNGILGMVVNNWFIYRDFGKGIRKVITDEANILYLIDLGDFGKELFRAMNNPLIIVLQKKQGQSTRSEERTPSATVIRTFKKKGVTAKRVIEEVAELVKAIETGDSEIVGRVLEKFEDHVCLFYIPQEFFKNEAEKGWRLAPQEMVDVINDIISLADKGRGYRLTDLFIDKQGVTTGSNKVFILDEKKIHELSEKGIDLRKEPLLFKCLAGREIQPWRIDWHRRWIILPYVKEGDEWRLAFIIQYKNAKVDALDLSKYINKDEKNMGEEDRLTYRIALGLIRYPNTARYLFQSYDQLRNRVFEDKRIEEYAGSWYGYHRVRDLNVLTSKPKIVTPRLCDKPSFALDTEGYLPLDSVIALVPSEKFDELKNEVYSIPDKQADITNKTLLYVLAFLNSRITHLILSLGAPRTPKGDYSIDEQVLSKIVIPKPSLLDRKTIEEIITLSEKLCHCVCTDLQQKLDKIIAEVYSKLLPKLGKLGECIKSQESSM